MPMAESMNGLKFNIKKKLYLQIPAAFSSRKDWILVMKQNLKFYSANVVKYSKLVKSVNDLNFTWPNPSFSADNCVFYDK